MKKLYTAALLVLAMSFGAAATAQTATKATTAQPAPLSAKAKALCKTWNFKATFSFDLMQDPTDAQKKDVLIFSEDGHYRWIYNGTPIVGTWTLDKSNVYISLTQDNSTNTYRFKLMESSDTSIRIDYRDADETHNILIYEAAK